MLPSCLMITASADIATNLPCCERRPHNFHCKLVLNDKTCSLGVVLGAWSLELHDDDLIREALSGIRRRHNRGVKTINNQRTLPNLIRKGFENLELLSQLFAERQISDSVRDDGNRC